MGSTEADIKQYPYQGSLQLNGRHICSCVILNKDSLITTGRCSSHLRNHTMGLTVRVGSTDYTKGKIYVVREIRVHPEYNQGARYNNDIAVIKVKIIVNKTLSLSFSNTIYI